MMRRSTILGGLACGVLAAGCAPPESPGKPPTPSTGSIPWLSTLGEGLATARAESKPVMVMFGAEWWGACNKLKADSLSDPKVVRLAREFVPVYVDLDADRGNTVSRFPDLKSIPDTRFLSPGGDQIGRIHGYLGPDDFAARMQEILDR